MITPVLIAFALAPTIIPKPVSLTMGEGAGFVVTSTTQIRDERRTFASRFLQDLMNKGGHVRLRYAKSLRLPGIAFEQTSDLPEEGYRLDVDSTGIRIQYRSDAGALYAVETLRQLLPAGIDSPKGTNAPLVIPSLRIEDSPRFPWRGMHLDVSRHFFPVSFIKRYLDYIAMMKMNIFHWHLVDDGGWRIQIDKYPRLTSVGAWRYGVTDGWDQGSLSFDPATKQPKYGGFYTKAQVRDVVKYAADRGITVVPEIEMPGHSLPVFAAYPELGCLNQPASNTPGQPSTNVYCAGNEKSYLFIEDVLTEVMDLFPSKWIHIGGDEVWKGYWQRCPRCQARMKEEGLKNEEELQSYFVQRIDRFLTAHGRRMVGWDEILEGGLAKGATVMSWRGIDGGIAAAKSGHDVVMSPTSHAYFDYSYDNISTDHVLDFDPVPAALSADEAKYVLGGQANVWTEWIPTIARCETMIWPRMAAMAEVLWSPAGPRDHLDFANRVAALLARLDAMGTSYYLGAPRVPAGVMIYTESCQVAATPIPGMPGTLRYAYGADPITAKSKPYSGPITITGGDQIVHFAYVTEGGRVGDVATVTAKLAQKVELDAPVAGWRYATYAGQWKKTPDFTTLTPVKSGVTASVGIGERPSDNGFALRFEGYLHIEQEGMYRFSLSSDDGSWLDVGGARVIDADGLHAASAKSGQAWLPAGWVRIEVGYFQSGGGLSLNLTMNGKPLDGLVFHRD